MEEIVLYNVMLFLGLQLWSFRLKEKTELLKLKTEVSYLRRMMWEE